MSISLADLDATKAAEVPFEFEYVKPNGNLSGITLKVLGGNCDAVRSTAAAMINARRTKEAHRQAKAAKSGRGNAPVEIDTVESDIEFGQRLAAVRLVGWEGIRESWSAENAALLCRTNPDIAAQVMEQSDALGNFMKN